MVGVKQACFEKHNLLTRVPEPFSKAQFCHHVCYPVLAKHIAKADTRLHATPWPIPQVVLSVEAADMV
jgi:hypothetical protein